jgi:hypothetical protein
MAGELSGLSFGTYDGMVKDLKKDYRLVPDQNAKLKGNKHGFNLFDKEGRVAGNGFKGNIKNNEYSVPQYTNAVIFRGNLQYGTSANNEEDLNKFDYISNNNGKEYAIDLNGNGKVDDNEIFSGRIDFSAYLHAKKDGDLNKYKDYLEQHNYGFLKK